MNVEEILLQPEHHWVCPNCTTKRITHEARPHTPMHNCKGMKGLSVPFVAEGTKCKRVLRRPDDFVKNELVQYDKEDGLPVMSVETWREDGQDCTVYAPAARAEIGVYNAGNEKSGRNVSVGAQTARVIRR